jgi:hypothetical protein
MRRIFCLAVSLFLFGVNMAFCDDAATILAAKEKEFNKLYNEKLAKKGIIPDTKQVNLDQAIACWESEDASYLKIVDDTDDQTRTKVLRFLAGKYKLTHQLPVFEENYIYYSALKLIQKRDADSVVFVLANLPVVRSQADPISGHLAASEIPDGILLLFQAYTVTTDDAIKQSLLLELRDDFQSVSKKSSSDSLFLAQASNWYKSHKDQFAINPAYYETHGINARVSTTDENIDLYLVKAP